MAYTPFTWHDGPGGNTPIVASRLNAIEQGIADAHDVTDALASLVPSVSALLDSAIVDHNLDVSNPANGYYIRWSTGLQFVFWPNPILNKEVGGGLVEDYQGINHYMQDVEGLWTFPAAFTECYDIKLSGNNLRLKLHDDSDYWGFYRLFAWSQSGVTVSLAIITTQSLRNTNLVENGILTAWGRWQ